MTLSLYFTVRNLGKKSVTLDMDSADGRRRLETLLDNADVWIESNRALDLNRREILDRHPQLIITSITPFGLTGPYRDYHVTDAVLVAMSGLLFRSGAPDKPPLLPPGALTADIASTTAAFATVMALYNRTQDRTRRSSRRLDHGSCGPDFRLGDAEFQRDESGGRPVLRTAHRQRAHLHDVSVR